jgi:hypothetical protein
MYHIALSNRSGVNHFKYLKVVNYLTLPISVGLQLLDLLG